MKTEINFLACKHLDFADNYTAKKETIGTKYGTKICWHRPTIDSSYPSLVQFCRLRGRLNYPTACLCQGDKMCSEYNDFNHTVTFEGEIETNKSK